MIRSLLKSEAFDHPADDVRLIQTHISWILLSGEFAYKIKKPVRFGFLDYSTLSRRRAMCGREVALNKRTCPAAYLGVVSIVERNGKAYLFGRGRTIEYAVKMRRLSAEGWLSQRVERGEATVEMMRRVAESVQAFHASAATSPGITAFGSADELAAIWNENLEEITPFAGDTISADELRDVTSFGERFLALNHTLIDQRASEGRVRDVHGDLRTDSIYIEPDGHICLTDCIEFSDRLRCGDIAGDVGFLAMDLDFRGRADLADEFAGRYVELSPDDEVLPYMLHFFRCYRALVRGKVESITTREPEIARDQVTKARERARRYFALAQRYATDEPPPSLIIVGGLSGSGKSHLAAALAARIGAVLVRSDAVRKQVLSDQGAPSYSRDERARVYEAARARVRTHVEVGRSVVFDATHLAWADRQASRVLARELAVPALLVWVVASEDVIRVRLASREPSSDGLSDARWDTYLAQRDQVQAPTAVELIHGIEVNGAQPATTNVDAIEAKLSSDDRGRSRKNRERRSQG